MTCEDIDLGIFRVISMPVHSYTLFGAKRPGTPSCPQIALARVKPTTANRTQTDAKHLDHENPPSYSAHPTPCPVAPNPDAKVLEFRRIMSAMHLSCMSGPKFPHRQPSNMPLFPSPSTGPKIDDGGDFRRRILAVFKYGVADGPESRRPAGPMGLLERSGVGRRSSSS